MRRVTHADLVAVARHLVACPQHRRLTVLEHLLSRAQAADMYRRAFRRVHPCWGDGTLGAAAWHGDLPCEPALSDRDYMSCLALVLMRLIRFEDEQSTPAKDLGGGIAATMPCMNC